MLTSADVVVVTRAFEEHVVCTNQEYDTVDYHHGLEVFLHQVESVAYGEEVVPNPYIEVPLEFVHIVFKSLN